MNKKIKNKFLIIVATHGDERIGLEVMSLLKKMGASDKFDSIIGNPKALLKNKRFIDADLNRVYPGKRESKIYEESRAAEIIDLAKNYDYVIDIHQMISSREDVIIIPHETIKDKKNISKIKIEKVILWPSTSGRKTGPLAQFLDNCLEIEIGLKGRNMAEAADRTAKIISDFINSYYSGAEIEFKHKIFHVYGKLMAADYLRGSLVDFHQKIVNNEKFIPFLCGQYLSSGIVCYKMKLITRRLR